MSQRCHEQTHAPQKTELLNHLVGAREQCRWHDKPKGLGGLQINYKLELGRLLNWQVSRFGTFENFTRVDTNLTVGIHDVRIVAHQATGGCKVAKLINCGKRRCCSERDQLVAMHIEDRIAAD